MDKKNSSPSVELPWSVVWGSFIVFAVAVLAFLYAFTDILTGPTYKYDPPGKLNRVEGGSSQPETQFEYRGR